MSKTEINSFVTFILKVTLVVLATVIGAKADDSIGDFDNMIITVGNGKCHVEFLDGIIEEIKETAPNATLKQIASYACDDFGYSENEITISYEFYGITIKDPTNNSRKYVIDSENKFENEYYKRSFDNKMSRTDFVRGIWSDYHFKAVKNY
jgi:hypothetical protein